MLMRDIRRDFPHFTMCLAPVQSSLESDVPGMGGFVYKDLWNSREGSWITYLNGQFYGDFSLESFESCVENGYPAKIVIGMIFMRISVNVLLKFVKYEKNT